VTDPEPGIPEDLHGAVITALNEEAVASAALANKAGINLIHTYEAFGTKMQGVLRQEIIFAQHCKELGRPQHWLSVPLVLTSHTWENSKNELSHQDPALAESMLGETSDISRVVFVPDFNTAAAVVQEVYQTHGQIWSVVVPKAEVIADLFTPDEARRLFEQGAILLEWAGHDPQRASLVLTAVGAYQLEEVLKASDRLKAKDIAHRVVYMLEPGRFRDPRNASEQKHVVPRERVEQLYPATALHRLFVTHTRPEPLLGVLQPLHTGSENTRALGFIGRGGTLTVSGMLYVNRSTWAHIVAEAARLMEISREAVLTEGEIAAIDGRIQPEHLIL
jgi:phosphoketolase